MIVIGADRHSCVAECVLAARAAALRRKLACDLAVARVWRRLDRVGEAVDPS